ncbi:MAG: hypothetical protein V2B19_06065 [Pseudomonadota bacterium]
MCSKEFTEKTKEQLGATAKGRKVLCRESDYQLREPTANYLPDFDVKNDDIEAKNGYLWDAYDDNSLG